VAGLPASCSAWLAPAARRPAASTPASPQPAQPKEAPAEPEAGDATFYLLCRTKNRDTGALGLQEQLAPIRTVRTVVRLEPLAGKKEASQLISTHPLVNKPGPSTTDGEKVRASVPADATAASTLWIWCPLHETSVHDMMTCHYLNSMVEEHKRHLAEHAAVGIAHVCFSCGQEGHISHDCPDKVVTLADQETGAVLVRRPAGGAAPFVATWEELPGVATPTLSTLAVGKAALRSTQKRPGPHRLRRSCLASSLGHSQPLTLGSLRNKAPPVQGGKRGSGTVVS
jgi:hypothetical protein